MSLTFGLCWDPFVGFFRGEKDGAEDLLLWALIAYIDPKHKEELPLCLHCNLIDQWFNTQQ